MKSAAPVERPVAWKIRRRWSLGALLWSAVYLGAAVSWAAGAPNFPYGRHWDPAPIPVSLMDGLSRTAATTIMIVVSGALVGATLWLAVARRAGAAARGVTLMVVAACCGLVVVGDYRPLMAVARIPVFVITHLVWGVGQGRIGIGTFVQNMISVPALHGFWQLGGVVLLLLALREFWSCVSDGCRDCGRTEAMHWWTTRAGARRWGLGLTVVAVLCPLPYALSRYLLLAGVPADGFSRDQIRLMDAEAPGIWLFGAGLATFGVLGAVLTLGLVQRWGERWPFWVPFLRGRPVNPFAAIIPAGFVSLLFPGTALLFLRQNIHRHLGENAVDGSGIWAVILAPSSPWVIWGFALAGATLAYWLRRRPDCETCGRGAEPMRGVWRREGRP